MPSSLKAWTTNDPLTFTFLKRLCLLGGTFTALSCTLFVWTGSQTSAITIAGLGATVFIALHIAAHYRWRATPMLFLVHAWTVTGLLDEGFSSSSATWVFHIPTALVGWALFSHSRLRWVAVAMPLAICLLSNAAVVWGFQVAELPTFPLRSHVALHFLGAFVASILCVQYLMTMERDARRNLEEARTKAERASHAKDEFLSHMSHEFRTPLNAIHGFSELLVAQAKEARSPHVAWDADHLDHLTAIQSATEHLTHIVNDILDLSRLESGEIRLQERSFSPDKILQSVRESLLPRAQEKRLMLLLEMPNDLPRLTGDQVRWKQILLNLVGNAIKFSQHGEIRILVSWHPNPDTPGLMVVRVCDEGPGIPRDMSERIFERFVRAESVDRSGTNGTGLGLAISRNLAAAMGGRLVLESSSPKGSIFRLSIPFLQASVQDEGSGAYPRQFPISLKGRRILLCEDNRMNIRLATKLLDRLEAGYEVAEDGGEAMTKLQTGVYDLVLLDLHMPVASGFEVAEYLRSTDCPSGNVGIPILALTADAFEETRVKAKAAGADDFLSKPYSFSELALRTARLLEGRSKTIR